MPQTLFITDASAPLGRACAVRMGRAGWNLVLGGTSLSGLQGVCAELPHSATLPARCDPSDPANIVPVLAQAEDRFGRVDAVLFNNRARRGGWQRTLNARVAALAQTADLCAPLLERSGGQLIVAGRRGGARSLDTAMHTVARDAVRTIVAALDADWQAGAHSVSLVEPREVESHRDMARRIARVLMGNSVPGEPVPAQSTHAHPQGAHPEGAHLKGAATA